MFAIPNVIQEELEPLARGQSWGRPPLYAYLIHRCYTWPVIWGRHLQGANSISI